MNNLKPNLSAFVPPSEWSETPQDHEILLKSLEYFNDIDGGMTHFQITNFVLNDRDFPTYASKYFQARIEMFTRYTNILNAYYECQITDAEVELLDVSMSEMERKSAITARDRAVAKLLSAKRAQKLMRKEFSKKEATRQIRELKAFWDNHQYYGAMLKPGVTRELGEPEHWVTKASGKVSLTDRLKRWIKAEEPIPEQLQHILQGSFMSHRQRITLREQDKHRVAMDGMTRETLTNGRKGG